jgi:hypothetical protein
MKDCEQGSIQCSFKWTSVPANVQLRNKTVYIKLIIKYNCLSPGNPYRQMTVFDHIN